MKPIKSIALIGLVSLVAACAQQEEPEPLRPQPVFDKFGAGACEAGYVYMPGTVPERAECIPEDECTPTVNADGSVVECPPPERPRGVPRDAGSDDSSDSSSSGRDPTGAPGTPGRR